MFCQHKDNAYKCLQIRYVFVIKFEIMHYFLEHKDFF